MGCRTDGAKLHSILLIYEVIMEEEKQESFLFIGGIMDGQWLNVPDSARRWHVPFIEREVSYYYGNKQLKDLEESVPFKEERYQKFCLSNKGPHSLYIFVHENILTGMNTHYMWDIMCKLVNNYKVIK